MFALPGAEGETVRLRPQTIETDGRRVLSVAGESSNMNWRGEEEDIGDVGPRQDSGRPRFGEPGYPTVVLRKVLPRHTFRCRGIPQVDDCKLRRGTTARGIRI